MNKYTEQEIQELFNDIYDQQSIPLSIRLHINLSMNDTENWKDGDYLGDRGGDEEIKVIIDTVKEWIKDGDLNNF